MAILCSTKTCSAITKPVIKNDTKQKGEIFTKNLVKVICLPQGFTLQCKIVHSLNASNGFIFSSISNVPEKMNLRGCHGQIIVRNQSSFQEKN